MTTEYSIDHCNRFMQLHQADGCFVMPNAWGGGSAKLIQDAGFSAIGTTSAGHAYALGTIDGAAQVTLQQTLDNVREIVTAVNLPVSVDFENGFAHDAATVAQNVVACLHAGAAGCCIEDWSSDESIGSYSAEHAVERVRQAADAVHAIEANFVLTARSDLLLHEGDGAMSEAISRAKLFCEAGADCVYVPGIKTEADVEALLCAVDKPVNILVGIAGFSISRETLAAMGVRRLSLGGSLCRIGWAAISQALDNIARDNFEYRDSTISDKQLQDKFRT